jgi:pyruvate dehydrogenase E1 component alpha subunit
LPVDRFLALECVMSAVLSEFPGDVSCPVQLLSEDGERRDVPGFSLVVSDAEVGGLYRDMALVRAVDSEAILLQRQGEMGLWTSLRGQEAAQIGAGRALAEHDMVFPSYREHGIAWCRGMEMADLVGLWRGSTPGGWDPHRHNFATYTIVIGAQTLHAVGYAMGVARDGTVGTGDPGRDTAVLVCFGDGAMSQGDVSEAFSWAAAQCLPVVFFCQNNQYAISAPVAVQSRAPLYRRAAGFGFPGVQVDGNDVLATLAATRAALETARSGGGPVLIEAYTYRMNPHTTSDDAIRYRDQAEYEAWQQRDPIARVCRYLQRAGFDEEFFTGIDEEADKLATRFRSEVRALATVEMTSVFNNVYDEATEELLAQRAEMVEFLRSLQ